MYSKNAPNSEKTSGGKIYHSKDKRSCYFPPLLSNGDISFAPDAEGVLDYVNDDFKPKMKYAFDGIVVRAGRRSGRCYNLNTRLFPLGKFTFSEGSALTEWSQELFCESGYFESSCSYIDGNTVYSQGFIHPSCNIYALKKKFAKKANAEFKLTLEGYCKAIGDYMSITDVVREGNVCRIEFKMYGIKVFFGTICCFVDKDYKHEICDKGVTLHFCANAGEEVCFYYYLEDDMEGKDYKRETDALYQKIKECGYLGLFRECVSHFDSFYSLGYVRSSDKRLEDIYKTALYGVKCNTTKSSVAVGLNNGAWDGKYFAFDEYTSFCGLLGAGRLDLAKRVPSYRLYKCLDKAIKLASDSHRNEKTELMAKFHWQTGEEDAFELANIGHWLDHVFHIPLIGIAAFEYYEYSMDKDFLSECYRMIRACAKFFTKEMLYRDGDKLYIGKCTDLERLGSAVENPFMTTCGAIALLERCARAADILGIDKSYRAECEYVAKKLRENLPTEGGMYVPYLGCEQKSIAVFAGKFPFNVIDKASEAQALAWDDYERNQESYGNMYPVGKGLSPWYAGWKAVAYARVGDRYRAYAALTQIYNSVGAFDESFEINEENVHYRPWFSTAAGVYITAVNEMLLQTQGNTVKILPGIPHEIDVSFKLAAKGGITVEAKVEGGELSFVKITKNSKDVSENYVVEF